MTDKTPAEEVLCPVALTINLIGGKWKALILWNLLEGTMRYSALRKAVPDATPKMLTQQLRELEADGLVSRTVWPVVPPRVDYALTPTGESIKPILTALYVPLGRRLSGEKEPEVLLLDEAARRRIGAPGKKKARLQTMLRRALIVQRFNAGIRRPELRHPCIRFR